MFNRTESPNFQTEVDTLLPSYENPAIKVNGVTKLYRHFAAVKDLDLKVRRGEILGIVGHNGAGKTTTLKMLTGLVATTSDTIETMSVDIARDSKHTKRFTGYLPEESPLYENITVVEYLMFFSELYNMGKKQAQERIDLLLRALKLTERDKLTGELSKGMRRKVAIARTLLHNPKLLILDEPNSGLDPLTSFFIIDYLKTLRDEGKTIVLNAHNLFHIEYICDRVAIMKNGELLVCDSMKSIRESLSNREYEITFNANEDLDCERSNGNYVFKAAEVGLITSFLKNISENDWALVDLSIRQSALEDIYVKLMNDAEKTPASSNR